MRAVIDTNILLISIPTISRFRPIFNAIINRKIGILVSNEIISEYAEIIEQKTNAQIATNIIELLLNLSNVERIEPHFKWNLIENDKSDNKFVDSSIVGGADYIVTNDKHFNILKRIDFPKVNIISGEDFLKIIDKI